MSGLTESDFRRLEVALSALVLIANEVSTAWVEARGGRAVLGLQGGTENNVFHCFSLGFSMIFALGRSWVFLVALESLLGRLGAVLGRCWALLGGLGSLLGGLMSVLGGLGAVLGRSWAVLGRSWAVLGRSWALLGRSWVALGPSWVALGRS